MDGLQSPNSFHQRIRWDFQLIPKHKMVKKQQSLSKIQGCFESFNIDVIYLNEPKISRSTIIHTVIILMGCKYFIDYQTPNGYEKMLTNGLLDYS